MKKSILLLSIMILLSFSAFATKTSSIADGNWNSSGTWDNGVPGCFDTIVIAHSVLLTQNVNLNCAYPIYVIVDGDLDLNCWGIWLFSAGYELALPSGSALSINTGGSVTGCNGDGVFYNPPATITAGGNTIYDSDDNGTVLGPNYIGEPGTSLPVELISFTSEIEDKSISVNWQTASETNSEYFAVQRSNNSEDWETIGELKAAGNSNLLIDYTFMDSNPIEGANYYRLLQVDFDGKFEYFGPIYQDFVFNTKTETLRIFPNPNTDGQLNISIDEPMQKGDIIEVYDNMGRRLITLNVTADVNKVKLNVSELKQGVYIVRYQSRDSQLTERLIIQ
ncbi:MAG: T9SS type A sorting domain-containing protein [Bacteroidales bacterium]|nr:T9SS type A sorting domain-containing protein [Bacteroidales bacterium]